MDYLAAETNHGVPKFEGGPACGPPGGSMDDKKTGKQGPKTLRWRRGMTGALPEEFRGSAGAAQAEEAARKDGYGDGTHSLQACPAF